MQPVTVTMEMILMLIVLAVIIIFIMSSTPGIWEIVKGYLP